VPGFLKYGILNMAKLSPEIRKKVFEMLDKGESLKTIYDSISLELTLPTNEIIRCLNSIKNKWKIKNPDKTCPDSLKIVNQKDDHNIIPKNDEYFQIEESIVATGNNHIAEEDYYKIIAKDILSNKGFTNIKNGPKIPGTPFDLIAVRNNEFSIIELKGSLSSFHYPSDVQFSRMKLLLEIIGTSGIIIFPYILLLNLRRGKKSIYYKLDEPHVVTEYLSNRKKNIGIDKPFDKIIKELKIIISDIRNEMEK
jgi:hypothetical protein